MAKDEEKKVIEERPPHCHTWLGDLEGDIEDVVQRLLQLNTELIEQGYSDIKMHIGYSDYDDERELQIFAKRLETDAEVRRRIKARDKSRAKRKVEKLKKEERERKEFERLKKKFGGLYGEQ